MNHRAGPLAGVASLLLLAPAGADPGGASNPIPFPHPQITEVLFDVPAAEAGDANGDGQRHAAGDEFVEIANPHAKPINLKGYALTSRLASPGVAAGRGVRFVFPDVELAPHAIAVVFNGCESKIPEPVGTPEAAPSGGNALFGGAMVFTMANTSRMSAFKNDGDYVLLSAPDSTPIDCIAWGKPDPPPPKTTIRISVVDERQKGSVQRLTPHAEPESHNDIDGKLFSPGVIPKPVPKTDKHKGKAKSTGKRAGG